MQTAVGIYTGLFSITGLGSPYKRGAFCALAGFLAQMFIKPSISYNSQGIARPFITSGDQNSTFLPWWSWSVVGGLVGTLFL